MRIFDKKSQMLYKNEQGGRIMVRVTLPVADGECGMNILYDALAEGYLLAAKEFINKSEERGSCFLDVSYEMEEAEKYIKIKRLSTLKSSGKALRSSAVYDLFEKQTLKLKK